ncbi:hypothetical protein [Halomonas sp. BM-2019]|uniref:hypothetical protein n=1 Tax=Halomonas sp. BM-2019 TaxID=2811227 RepID=UPI001B3C2E60|nr:MAG: hypothetical protein J5F18_05195 [Halomonas sp. BM-2019]
MADTTTRMAELKARIQELADLAAAEHRERARVLSDALASELERLFEAPPPPPTPTGKPPRAPRDEVERCPVCTLRSYHYQRGTIRQSEYGGYEAFYRCGSCAHEGWKEIA